MISIIVYFQKEIDFKEKKHDKLQKLFDRYMFIVQRGNLHDLCNLILFFREYKIIMPPPLEDELFDKIKKSNDPILIANYLLYSYYDTRYFQNILKTVEQIIENNINQITIGQEVLQKEFWYLLIFYNCPFISNSITTSMEDIINRMKTPTASLPNELTLNLICDYLLNCRDLFFTWGVHKFSVSKQIAYRTYQRSLFRQYKKNINLLYGSLDS